MGMGQAKHDVKTYASKSGGNVILGGISTLYNPSSITVRSERHFRGESAVSVTLSTDMKASNLDVRLDRSIDGKVFGGFKMFSLNNMLYAKAYGMSGSEKTLGSIPFSANQWFTVTMKAKGDTFQVLLTPEGKPEQSLGFFHSDVQQDVYLICRFTHWPRRGKWV